MARTAVPSELPPVATHRTSIVLDEKQFAIHFYFGILARELKLALLKYRFKHIVTKYGHIRLAIIYYSDNLKLGILLKIIY